MKVSLNTIHTQVRTTISQVFMSDFNITLLAASVVNSLINIFAHIQFVLVQSLNFNSALFLYRNLLFK